MPAVCAADTSGGGGGGGQAFRPDLVPAFLEHPDWKYRHAALCCISQARPAVDPRGHPSLNSNRTLTVATQPSAASPRRAPPASSAGAPRRPARQARPLGGMARRGRAAPRGPSPWIRTVMKPLKSRRPRSCCMGSASRVGRGERSFAAASGTDASVEGCSHFGRGAGFSRAVLAAQEALRRTGLRRCRGPEQAHVTVWEWCEPGRARPVRC